MTTMTSEQRAADRQLAGDQIRLVHSVMASYRYRLSRRGRLVRLAAINESGGWRAS
jgi:hypothetical protein